MIKKTNKIKSGRVGRITDAVDVGTSEGKVSLLNQKVDLPHNFRNGSTFSSGRLQSQLNQPKIQGQLDYVINCARAAGVKKMVVTVLKLNNIKSSVVMAQTCPNIIYAAVAVYPHFVKENCSEKTINALGELVKQTEVLVVGEVGSV